MEENTMVETLETQPEADNVETETTAETIDETENVDQQASDAQDTETNAETADPNEAIVIPTKFNKQMRYLSVTEARDYAEKGMKYDSLSPVLESLKYVAASEGKTLAEFVEAVRHQHDANLYAAFMDRCGGDEELAKQLLEVEKGKHQAAYEDLLKTEKAAETETEEAITKRLADELAEVRAEFPDIASFDKLPQSVIREADAKGISLLDALLRHEHREQRKTVAAKAEQAAAAKASAGAQAAAGTENTDPTIAAMMKGIWG